MNSVFSLFHDIFHCVFFLIDFIYTCNGVSNGGRNFFVGPLPVVEGNVQILAINDPDPSRTLATRNKMEIFSSIKTEH